MNRFDDKVAVITGGNSGIGVAAAKRLHDEGARVAISGRNQKTFDEAVKMLEDDVLAVQTDVSKPAETNKLFSAVSREFGKVDILFANAGVAKFAPLDSVTEEFYDE
ncbi:MAG: SDR family NAD(P)-dependent oxidoreductase [Acidobacteriaceae bacterium]|nr:SDR family NAD(P)-dependent oxidoreductase [Acidobacteriaceae bacterium]